MLKNIAVQKSLTIHFCVGLWFCNRRKLSQTVVCFMSQVTHTSAPWSLHWRHNECDGVSNQRRPDCLLNRLFRRRSKKTSKFRVTGGFPSQKDSNAENVFIWWRHNIQCAPVKCYNSIFVCIVINESSNTFCNENIRHFSFNGLYTKAKNRVVMSYSLKFPVISKVMNMVHHWGLGTDKYFHPIF